MQFQDGASVSKISLLSDFSALRLTGLPTGSSAASVVVLLAELGRIVPETCVRIVRGDTADQVAADVLVEEPGFAKAVCREAIPLGSLAGIHARQVTPSLSVGTNARRVERRKIQCSWFKPCKRARLTYATQQNATTVYSKFERQIYMLCGSKVRCTRPSCQAGGGPFSRQQWTIMLTDLPAAVTRTEIESVFVAVTERPERIEVSPATYEADGEEACASVLSLLAGIGPIEWSQANTLLEGKRAKAVARFCDESDALQAEKDLDNSPLPFCPGMKLNVQLLSTAKFKVRTNVFKIVGDQVRVASDGWTKQGVQLKVYPPADPTSLYRVVKVEGPKIEEVGAAKEDLQRILDGEKLLDDDGTPLWSVSLRGNNPLFTQLKHLGSLNGLIITRDVRRKEIRAIGPAKKVSIVKGALVERLRLHSSSENTIPLEPDAFRWACRGGFQSILRALGPGAATFDVTTKVIITNGTERAYTTASRMIKQLAVLETAGNSTDDGCPVCFTEVDSPVRISCGHVYCAECFEAMCAHAGTGDAPFELACLGKEGKCKEIVTLMELQENLTSAAFEDILEASFGSYIQCHPQRFGYCETPGCTTVYRKNVEPRLHVCTICFARTCTTCHAQHEGESCAEYRDKITGAYEATEKLKRELGIKDCPECKTSIEKTEGCNHMQCKACKAHICWCCMACFPSGDACYQHLSSEHGGAFEFNL